MENIELLKDMFELQGQLNRRIGVDTTALPEEKKTEWILNYCRAMSQELAELTDSVPWKWWAKYQTFDKQNAKVEVIDLFHFLISLAQTLDMSAEDVHELYCRKHRVNQERQDSGYTTKDESDNRSLT
jgi:dimeric dUTPase (all-alpha-NTP-PPase superfamily)